MAKPRVFVSSTFYDLRQVRSDLELFIQGLGFEPVLNERGHIPYGKDRSLEQYCYKEISNSDLFVSVVGGRFGCQSFHQNMSISQMEFRTALELKKQVYIFIEKNVFSEYQTYLLNKHSKEIRYRFADDVRIYSFIEYCEKLPQNNAICPFESSKDITSWLKEQWAGLFQQFLRSHDPARINESTVLTENGKRSLEAYCMRISENPECAVPLIQTALWVDHPAVRWIRNFFDIRYRFYFVTDEELDDWLATRRFRRTDYLYNIDEMIYCRLNRKQMKKQLLVIKREIFTLEGELKPCHPSEWASDSIQYHEEPLVEEVIKDLPF